MKAVVIREVGALELTDQDAQKPARGQVRLRVGACGVCYRDLVDRRGGYPFMRMPIVTGHEFGGEIIALGPDAGDFAVGDRVVVTHRPACGECEACRTGNEARCAGTAVMYGLTADGGYAEEANAWASSLVRVPKTIAIEQAAFLHCTAGVALRALRTHARLRAGETVLVTGASGGVGVHAIQVAKILGARVIAVTSSPQKVEAIRAVGADSVIVSDSKLNRQVMAQGGADVALELTGAPTFNGALRSLRPGGRMVVVGNVTQQRVEVNPGYLILNEITIAGSSSATRADLADVLGWAAAGKLKPVIADRLPLERAAEAQERLAKKGVVGRMVLIP